MRKLPVKSVLRSGNNLVWKLVTGAKKWLHYGDSTIKHQYSKHDLKIIKGGKTDFIEEAFPFLQNEIIKK